MKNGIIGILLLLALCLAGCSETQVKPTEDIVDALIVVPPAIVERFDDSERTRMVYNIAVQREVIVALEKRVIALESSPDDEVVE